MRKTPQGTFLGGMSGQRQYRATGEYRAPRKGEFYLSGIIISVHHAPINLVERHWIAEEFKFMPCPTCKGTGKICGMIPAQEMEATKP